MDYDTIRLSLRGDVAVITFRRPEVMNALSTQMRAEITHAVKDAETQARVGIARAMGAALFAEPVSAEQAVAWGMIWEAVPDEEFAAHWQARAAQLAAGPTETYAHVKTALRKSLEHDLEDQLELEAKLQGECGRTRDFKEGVMAFLEKRPAKFEGR